MAQAPKPPEGEKRPESVKESVMIQLWLRWLSGILGLGGMAVGGVAVFESKLETGPIALLAVGLILFLIGLAGRLPRRLKIGDNEAEFYEEKYVKTLSLATDLAANIDPKSQPEAVATMQGFRDSEPEAGAKIFNALGYEAMVREMLRDIVRRRGDQFVEPADLIATADVTKTPGMQPTHFDGMLIRKDGKRRGLVEVKASTGDIDRSWIQLLHDRFVRGVQQYQAELLLFITKEPLERAAGIRLGEFADKVWVIVSGPHDMVNLEAGVERVIGKLGFEQ